MKRLFLAVSMIAAAAFAETSAGPSAESLAACSGRDVGAECTITFDDGAHAGTCMQAPRDEAPNCMPRPVPPAPVSPPPLLTS